MELSEIILASVGALSTISAWVVKNLVADVKELEHTMNRCQSNLPRD